MMNCPICAVTQKQMKSLVLYEDELVMAILYPYPTVKGHTVVFPKQHVQILTLIEDAALERMYSVAQRLSSVLFDGLGAQGTNLLIQNGESAGQSLPHCLLHILPRSANDGVNLEWQPTQAKPEELALLETTFKETIAKLAAAQNVMKADEGKPSYQLKQLRRIP